MSIDAFPKEIVLCHNDINMANFLIDRSKNLWIIDFEYACFNDLYFDLASLKNILEPNDFEIFLNYYSIKINENKLKMYLVLVNYISMLWYLQYSKNPIYYSLAKSNMVKLESMLLLKSKDEI